MSEPTTTGIPQPSIMLVSEEYADRLRDEFWRYSREYDLRTARSCAEAMSVSEQIHSEGGTVALFVADSRLPGENILAAFGLWRTPWPGRAG